MVKNKVGFQSQEQKQFDHLLKHVYDPMMDKISLAIDMALEKAKAHRYHSISYPKIRSDLKKIVHDISNDFLKN